MFMLLETLKLNAMSVLPRRVYQAARLELFRANNNPAIQSKIHMPFGVQENFAVETPDVMQQHFNMHLGEEDQKSEERAIIKKIIDLIRKYENREHFPIGTIDLLEQGFVEEGDLERILELLKQIKVQ